MREFVNDRTRCLAILFFTQLTLQPLVPELDLGTVENLAILFQGFLRGLVMLSFESFLLPLLVLSFVLDLFAVNGCAFVVERQLCHVAFLL